MSTLCGPGAKETTYTQRWQTICAQKRRLELLPAAGLNPLSVPFCHREGVNERGHSPIAAASHPVGVPCARRPFHDCRIPAETAREHRLPRPFARVTGHPGSGVSRQPCNRICVCGRHGLCGNQHRPAGLSSPEHRIGGFQPGDACGSHGPGRHSIWLAYPSYLNSNKIRFNSSNLESQSDS